MTETKDSGETQTVGYLNDSVINVKAISDAVVAGFRAELLKEIDKAIQNAPNGEIFAPEIREIVANFKF